MGDANFDTYAVFLPNDPEGVQDGSFHLVKVLALDHADAITKASIEWYGTNGTREGVYLVCIQDDLTAYEVEEERRPSVRNEVSLP